MKNKTDVTEVDSSALLGVWQPIETAPPRETVIVGDASKVGAGFCNEFNRWFVYGTFNIPMETPTHWMPFPSPPNIKDNYESSEARNTDNTHCLVRLYNALCAAQHGSPANRH